MVIFAPGVRRRFAACQQYAFTVYLCCLFKADIGVGSSNGWWLHRRCGWDFVAALCWRFPRAGALPRYRTACPVILASRISFPGIRASRYLLEDSSLDRGRDACQLTGRVAGPRIGHTADAGACLPPAPFILVLCRRRVSLRYGFCVRGAAAGFAA